MYAEVIIDISHSNIDKIFDYCIPDTFNSRVSPGMRVLVPFGKQKKPVEGYIIKIKESTDYDPTKVKGIKDFIDTYPAILPQLIKLAFWIKKEYHCLLVDALRLMIPAPMRKQRVKEKTKKIVRLLLEETELQDEYQKIRKNATKQRAILSILSEYKEIELPELEKVCLSPLSSLKYMEKKGWIELSDRVVLRRPYQSMNVALRSGPVLTQNQQEIIDKIVQGIDKEKRYYLLHGVTGSGKTEIYLRVIKHLMERKKNSIVLVPEISLTPQMVERFRERFGNHVAVLHSRLSIGERYDEWRRIRFGQVKVVVGARSAVFAPLDNLGIIIMDEEHEQSYRSETNPRYDASEVARSRCENEGAILLMGSATPSLENYYKCQSGEYILLEMPDRINGRPLPPIDIVDMRQELIKGNRSIFSISLYNEIKKCLSKDEQIILFLNRRGYSTFVSCRECGYIVKCNQCEVSMTYHQGESIMKCHYCGNEQAVPMICPNCHSKYIKYFGTGTQRVEEEIQKLFKEVKVLRMDNDTTQTKDAHLNILTKFRQKKAQILVGTQMIAKGLDFPSVTLVGVIAADTMLNLPDFRSAEKTFQIITQVAGRAGRSTKEGKVIVQTYSPEHFSIQKAANHDYYGFYIEELENRRVWQYPPYSRIIRYLLQSDNEDMVKSSCQFLRDELDRRIISLPEWKQYVLYLGHMPAPISKVKGRFRWQVILKIKENIATDVFTEQLIDTYDGRLFHGSTVYVEVNPTSML